MAIRPRAHDDRERLQEALSDIAQKDPSVKIKMDTLDGQTEIGAVRPLPGVADG
jgi:translation elongation factor EF-G